MIEEGRAPVEAKEACIPIDAIRLVHPIADPKTGVTRDVIIRELKPVDIYIDRPTRRTEFSRVVPGLNVEIPWPRKEEPEYHDAPGDTLRIEVEAKTFVPTLLRPPMPEHIMEELRNRFSRFRTRHEPEYIAKKEAEAAEKVQRRKMVQTMRTPLQEFHTQQKALRKARGQPVLTDEMLQKIGQVISRNKKIALEADVPPRSSNNVPLDAAIPPPPEARPPPS